MKPTSDSLSVLKNESDAEINKWRWQMAYIRTPLLGVAKGVQVLLNWEFSILVTTSIAGLIYIVSNSSSMQSGMVISASENVNALLDALASLRVEIFVNIRTTVPSCMFISVETDLPDAIVHLDQAAVNPAVTKGWRKIGRLQGPSQLYTIHYKEMKSVFEQLDSRNEAAPMEEKELDKD